MLNIQLIAAIILLLVTQWSDARSLNGASANRRLVLEETSSSSQSASDYPFRSKVDVLKYCVRHHPAIENVPFTEGTNATSPPVPSLEFRKCPFCERWVPLNEDDHSGPLSRTITMDFFGWTTLLSTKYELIEKWPVLKIIGYARINCRGMDNVYMIACAHVERTTDSVSNFQQTLTQLEQDPKSFLNAQIVQNIPDLYILDPLLVYKNPSGNIISITEAYLRSMNAQTGEEYRMNLERISALKARVSSGAIAEQLSKFPALVPFVSDFVVFGRRTRIIRIVQALTFLCVESLHTEAIRARLQELNDEVVNVKAGVDDFLRTNYPNLVKFKNMGPFEYTKQTIENYVIAQEHSAMYSPIPYYYSSLNRGAGIMKDSVGQFIEKKYGECQILDLKLENMSGRDITFRTAIEWTLNPYLLRLDKENWLAEIEKQLKSHDCQPKNIALILSSPNKPEFPYGRISG